MIFHASIPADRPEHVAAVLAEIWQGEAFRFPPWPGAHVAVAGDERGSMVEVYPREQTLTPGDGVPQPQVDPAPRRMSCFHLAIATQRTAEEILAIGEREGWHAARCSRGGAFDVVELWIENCLLVEVLTLEMQQDYLSKINLDTWRELAPAAAALA
jgi:hypothetical protein